MSSRRKHFFRMVAVLILVATLNLVLEVGMVGALAQEAPQEPAARQERTTGPVRWDLSLAISVAIGLPCLAAGYAVARVGAAALGAASEKPELLTRSLIFVALAEGIAIYGLLVAVLLYRQF